MTDCGSYVATPSFQIGAGPTGSFDCSAHATSDFIDQATCGRKTPGGRTIRLLSSEPIPNPKSPGLNLPQCADVAREEFGVQMDVRIGGRAVDFEQYETWRFQGRPLNLQVGYAPISDSKYDAFNGGFRGNHMIFESVHATYDPGADGRRAGIFEHDGSVYDRSVIKRAAGMLEINRIDGKPVRLGFGKVWCAVGTDVIESYRARVPKGDFWAYWLVDGRIKTRRLRKTGGFSATCTAPRAYLWPSKGKTAHLVRLTSGSRAGTYISANWAEEA